MTNAKCSQRPGDEDRAEPADDRPAKCGDQQPRDQTTDEGGQVADNIVAHDLRRMAQVATRAVRPQIALQQNDRVQRIVVQLLAQIRNGRGEVVKPIVHAGKATVDIRLIGTPLSGKLLLQVLQLSLGDTVDRRGRRLDGVDAHALTTPAVERPAVETEGDRDDGDDHQAQEASNGHEAKDEGFGHASP